MKKDLIEKNKIEEDSLDYLRLQFQKRISEQSRRDFEFAETQLFLSQQQNFEDTGMIMEKVSEWMDSIQKKKPDNYSDDDNYKMFNAYIRAIFRIESYCRNIEVSNKKAIVEYLNQKRETEKYIGLYSQEKLQNTHNVSKYEIRIKNLEQQLEFIEKNSKP